MKLFLFEHCPHCIKAEMVAHYKGVTIEKVYLQNDDVEARIEKVGANMVPILQKPDGSYMPESLDIAQIFDSMSQQKIILPSNKAEQVNDWLTKANAFSGQLTHPRWMKIELPEFQRPEAVAWYTKNKQAMIGMTFEQALANTAEFKAGYEECLAQIDFITLPSEQSNQISWDDVMLFPFIRNATVVKDLRIPERVEQYLAQIAELTTIRLFYDVAL